MLRKLLTDPIYRKIQLINRSSIALNSTSTSELNLNTYHEVSDNTLEELSESLESILEERYDSGADVSLNSGVLTVTVDDKNTYVINKQTRNRQIWLSSPLSGPKRFDYSEGKWVDKNSQAELKKLLSDELSQILKRSIDC